MLVVKYKNISNMTLQLRHVTGPWFSLQCLKYFSQSCKQAAALLPRTSNGTYLKNYKNLGVGYLWLFCNNISQLA